MPQQNHQDFPSFLIKSTQGVGITAAALLIPFTVHNFIQGRYLIALLTLTLLMLTCISTYSCYQGKYRLGINLFAVTPALIITSIIVLNTLGVTGSYWPFLVIVSFYFTLPEKPASIANLVFIGLLMPLSWSVLEPPVAMRFFAVILGISFFSFLSIREIHKQHRQLKKQSITDPLTGVYNRSLLQSSLENAIHQNRRTDTGMVLIMLDLDHFKKVNDELGHDVGDSALKVMGKFLNNHFRASDTIFRIGGEEFLVLTYNTNKASGLAVAEKLRKEVELLPIVPSRTTTVSVGVAALEPDMNWEQWMKLCDDNLYCAKSNGRNQVYPTI